MRSCVSEVCGLERGFSVLTHRVGNPVNHIVMRFQGEAQLGGCVSQLTAYRVIPDGRECVRTADGCLNLANQGNSVVGGEGHGFGTRAKQVTGAKEAWETHGQVS